MSLFSTMALPTFAAADDPLHHVLDSYVVPGWTWHATYLVGCGLLSMILVTYFAKRIVAGKGGTFTGMFEVILLYIRDEVVRPFVGKDGDRYLWLPWTIFFFIVTCNLVGLIPGSKTATGNISVTAGFAAVSWLVWHGLGIKENGFFHYWKSNILVGPPMLWPLMVPIEIFGIFVKPAALTIRLFANMVAGHVMLSVILGLFAVFSFGLAGQVGILAGSTLAATLLFFLELLVAFIQAFIFTFLTTVFLSQALHPDH